MRWPQQKRCAPAEGDADLLSRLAGDKRVGLGKKALQAILAENARFVARRRIRSMPFLPR